MPLPLIATDLDGTLLMTGSQTLHPDAQDAVHQAISAGIPLVFATGRSPIDILPVAELVGHRWFAVCGDGTAIVDLRNDEVLATHPMDENDLREIVSVIREHFPAARFMIDRVSVGIIDPKNHGLIIEEGFKAPWADAVYGSERIDSIEQALHEPNIVKICMYLPTELDHDQIFQTAKNLVSPYSTVVRIHSDEIFLDLCKL
jgi:HAD superfamily hydrolase (TIGR01484 family)